VAISDDEVLAVLTGMRPRLEAAFGRQGFVVLCVAQMRCAPGYRSDF
jgi:hypothetical protein